VLGVLALPAVLVALAPSFQSSVQPLPRQVQTMLRTSDSWQRGCPVGMSGLRLLTVSHWDFAGRKQEGQLVVNRAAAAPLARVFRRLYALHFPIRHLQLDDAYGTRSQRPRDGDVSGSFECRQAVPSPCVGRTGTGSWSMHAFGLAVDINPVENPYVGCGQSRDAAARRFRDRSVHRKGMVTRRAIAAFRSVGWGWGGAWAGNTKDYMHFSSTGH
jgi:hypothetical protein